MPLAEKYFRLSGDSGQLLYKQIQENIVELIDQNLLQHGDALPSERQLSEYYAVNRMTVRQAIGDLVLRGILHKRHGAGTYVSERRTVQTIMPTVVGFSQRTREAGLTPSSRLLHHDTLIPDPIVAHRLQIAATEQVYVIKRLRLIDNEPLMIETSYLAQGIFPKLTTKDLEQESLYRILAQDYGVQITEAEHSLEPTLPTAFEAHHLQIELTMPAMLVRVMAYTVDRVPVEFSKAVVRGDRCRYFFRVNTRIPMMS
jgi:GntR family transcriptional regulator